MLKSKCQIRIILLFILISALNLLIPSIWTQTNTFLLAAEFDRNYILSDFELFNYKAMTLEEIQEFLERQTGTLANYSTIDYDGKTRSAAEIIYNASQKYYINPQYLIVLLQREQSLIENPNPTDYNYRWATGFARCDDCNPEDPRIAIFGGFAKQVDRAAWRNRYYVEHPEEFSLQLNKTYYIDGQQVTPHNQATLNLYLYTPHIHGNYNFWKLWQRYFVKPYPDGSLLQEEGKPGVWLIQNGKKRPFLTKTALTSRFDEKKIITVQKNDLDKYDIGKPILFPQYSLVESPSGTVYLIVDDYRRGFTSSKVFRKIGFNREEVIKVGWEDLDYYTESTPISENSIYPTGVLLQDSSTGGVYYIKDGIKHPIWAKEILRANFRRKKVIPTSPEELENFPTGDPVKFKDGELITSPGHNRVYIISDGYKRPIVSKEVFETLGYKWENIIYTTDKAVELHPTGPEVTL